jgi:hypothetical protein
LIQRKSPRLDRRNDASGVLLVIYVGAVGCAPNLDARYGYTNSFREAEPMMDLVYLAAGVAIFAIFALYAVLLKRI